MLIINSFVNTNVNEYVSTIPYSLVTQLAAVELSAQKGLVAGQAELISKVTGRE
jgi:glucosamine--fructose-6-phosphate aminotransferase (isomerizing)